jgi:uncharacterized protein (TIGR03435 family)
VKWYRESIGRVEYMKNATPLFIILASYSCLAQSSAVLSSGPSSAFEVASVRLAVTNPGPGPRFKTSPDTLTIRGLSLRACITWAYQMSPLQIIGPDWLYGVRLNIVAKAAAPVDENQLYLMLRTLLAERLALRTHVELKEMPVYALTVANGAKFSESTTDASPTRGVQSNDPSTLRFSMGELARELSQPVGRPVLDATGLNGRYDIDMATLNAMNQVGVDGVDAANIMISGLKEMGLKVEARRDKVEVLIVDHAEKTPTEN